MSIPRTQAAWTDNIQLTCNFCGAHTNVMGARDKEMARRIARQTGWADDGKQDACPICAKEEV